MSESTKNASEIDVDRSQRAASPRRAGPETVAQWSVPELDSADTAIEGLWLLGTAGPKISLTRAGPGSVLCYGGTTALIDCGYGVLRRLAELGIGVEEVTHVLLTHLHADHVADLGTLIMSPWIQNERTGGPPVVVGPEGTFELVSRLLQTFDCDIRARIPHGYDPSRLAVPVVEVSDGATLAAGPWTAHSFLVDHWPVEPALGYRLESAMGSAVISGDTKPCPSLVRWARSADILIHEALYPGFGISSYHTLATDVGQVATEASVKHLVLTHLIPHDMPDSRWLELVGDIDCDVSVGVDLLRLQSPPAERTSRT